MRHYVYYSYEEWGRGYIGARSCSCSPEADKYLGSFSDKSFSPKHKVILQEFSTREEAIKAEIALHNFYKVNTNPHFANRAIQTSTGFDVSGCTLSDEHKSKIKSSLVATHVGDCNPFYGKTHSAETLAKISKASSERVRTKEERDKRSNNLRGERNPMHGKRGEKNPLFARPRLQSTKNKISNSKIGKRLYTNGTVNVFSHESPGAEFWLKSKKL